jgi:Histidine phosphatase superfamily (branch 1)
MQEVAVDRPGERPPVGGDGGHDQQPHARQPVDQLRRGQAALVGDDAAQVRARAGCAAVQESLQAADLLCVLQHPPITPRRSDINVEPVGIAVVFETHSTSEDNEQGRATGWQPGRLSEQGRRQARDLGLRRRDDGITTVFSSDLGRAVETATVAFGDSVIPVLHG